MRMAKSLAELQRLAEKDIKLCTPKCTTRQRVRRKTPRARKHTHSGIVRGKKENEKIKRNENISIDLERLDARSLGKNGARFEIAISDAEECGACWKKHPRVGKWSPQTVSTAVEAFRGRP
jgi:hypothetical protein